jgi:aspartyl-tRNA(Asn)/glutamyl-tRNA(Gln) amidotransferase subunit A
LTVNIDPTLLTISSARAALRGGEYSAADLTRACLERIERLNPRLNAFLTVTPELALAQAEQADQLLTRHPANLDEFLLLGIPLAVKDLFETTGVRTTAGSRFFNNYLPEEDAQAVMKLKLHAASLLGKTNTHEIALGVTGVNPHYGPVRNPHDPDRITGGSSSGSAAAVAAGLCLAALGTDTGGSIRIPASLCGVVGLKPTYGRVSTRGVFPLSWNLDHIGPLTRSVRDAAIMLQVLAGYDPHDPASADVPVDDYSLHLEEGVKGWRIALAVGEYIEAAAPAIMAGLDRAAAVLREAGASVEREDLSWLEDLARANGRMTQADAAAVHRDRLAQHPDWFGQDVRHRLEVGAALASADYVLARRTQSEGRRRFENFFAKYNLLLLPTTPSAALPIEGTGAIEAARQLTRFTAPFNLTGLPALSVPAGGMNRLPFGIQLVAPHWRESAALQAGVILEQTADQQPPPAE